MGYHRILSKVWLGMAAFGFLLSVAVMIKSGHEASVPYAAATGVCLCLHYIQDLYWKREVDRSSSEGKEVR